MALPLESRILNASFVLGSMSSTRILRGGPALSAFADRAPAHSSAGSAGKAPL